jgi:tRNA G18 (ribose-2'-O)-methylase SpoU
MAPWVEVDDAADARLADYRHLKDAAAHRAGAVVVEGVLALQALLASGHAVRSVLLSRARAATLAGELGPALEATGAPVYVAPRDVLAAVAGFDVHRGVLASAQRWELPTAESLLATAARVVVAEALGDLENVGALFRTAAALGAGAVLLDARTPDPRTRRAIRVSLGHVLRLPFARLVPWPEALGEVRAAGFTVAALTPGPGAEDLDDAGLDAVGRLALLVGAEGPGLSAGALAGADRRVRIPMAAGADSLNVATATAVALHVARPRGAS